MSTTDSHHENGDAVQQLQDEVRDLRTELREAKARIRRLESGGVDDGPVVDQYDRPVVEQMRSQPESYFGINSLRALYRSAGVTSREKVKERVQALVAAGVIDRQTVDGQYVWSYDDD